MLQLYRQVSSGIIALRSRGLTQSVRAFSKKKTSLLVLRKLIDNRLRITKMFSIQVVDTNIFLMNAQKKIRVYSSTIL